ncbi:MAG: O-antigen ligase family protein [Fusobacteria bacterium]|nr:O-antigen ligase family protein [Fusobacteriota bacterium]
MSGKLGSGRIAYGNYNVVGVAEVFGVAIVFSYYDAIKYDVNKIISVLIIFFSGFILVKILLTRGALFSAIISILILELFRLKKISLLKIISLVGIIFFIVIIQLPETYKYVPQLKRFSIIGIQNDASITGMKTYSGFEEGRLNKYQNSFTAINRHPIMGCGAGAEYSHNIFLELWSNFGIIGLMLFCGIIINIFYILRKKNNELRFLGVLLLFYLISRQFSYAFQSNKGLFIIIGIIIAYNQVIRRSTNEIDPNSNIYIQQNATYREVADFIKKK